DGAMTIRHGMRGIADVAVESLGGLGRGRVKGKFAVFAEIEVLGFGFARRPGIELHPNVAASLEKQGFLERKAAFVLEPVGKPRRFDIAPKIETGVATKRNQAERIARPMGPTTVVPGTGDEIIQVI